MAKYSHTTGFKVIDTLESLAKQHQVTPANIALAWLLANPVVTSAIIGARTVEQLRGLLKSVT